MAAAMLLGGKLGDRWGRHRTFQIGLLVFAAGSALTALAGDIAMLIGGWSVIDGVGAALLIPAMVALVADNYGGRQRVLSYGVLAAAAAAWIPPAGP